MRTVKTIAFPVDLLEELQHDAALEGRSLNNLVNRKLRKIFLKQTVIQSEATDDTKQKIGTLNHVPNCNTL